jgi:hypothetical protein
MKKITFSNAFQEEDQNNGSKTNNTQFQHDEQNPNAFGKEDEAAQFGFTESSEDSSDCSEDSLNCSDDSSDSSEETRWERQVLDLSFKHWRPFEDSEEIPLWSLRKNPLLSKQINEMPLDFSVNDEDLAVDPCIKYEDFPVNEMPLDYSVNGPSSNEETSDEDLAVQWTLASNMRT